MHERLDVNVAQDSAKGGGGGGDLDGMETRRNSNASKDGASSPERNLYRHH